MKWYYLAGLIWIVDILLGISIIGIPVLVYLIDNYEWFLEPFYQASIKAKITKRR